MNREEADEAIKKVFTPYLNKVNTIFGSQFTSTINLFEDLLQYTSKSVELMQEEKDDEIKIAVKESKDIAMKGFIL